MNELMQPTNTRDPQYYHKVVDCQWACPAHTNVPEYIRLIAEGRYTDAYMLNRESNVFPGILGRTCDRPCEPACRRERVDGKPVAICRLKRVAADLRESVHHRLPKIPEEKNGKRVALIGGGPASLTVANDLLPLGYECVLYEKLDKLGGLMLTNIPAFRLPQRVLDEEIGFIVDMGLDVRLNTAVSSMKALLDEGYDAVFVGVGAPRGKNLELPGRYDTDRIHIGIEWLESIAFQHIDSVGERVLVIGVGNTAMDCCRAAKRLGGKDVKVMARRGRGDFKASDWELEDAEGEQVEVLEYHSPKSYVVEDGVLKGMMFDIVEWYEDEKGKQRARACRRGLHPLRRRHPRHRPGQRLPVDRARHRHRVQRLGHADRGSRHHAVLPARGLLRGRRGVGPGEHHLGGGARPSGRHLHPQPLPGRRRWTTGRRTGSNLLSHEDGHPRVGLLQRLQPGVAHARCGTSTWRSGCAASAPRPSSASTSRRRRRRCSAASTATSRRTSRRTCASSATPASTSARCTA